jgi:hypothetical protein
VAASFGWVRTGQRHQSLLDVPLDLHLVRTRGLWASIDGDLQSTGDKLLANSTHRPQAAADRVRDGLIRFVSAMRVSKQEDTGMPQSTGRRFADRNQLLQFMPFFRRQCDTILFHVGLRARMDLQNPCGDL